MLILPKGGLTMKVSNNTTVSPILHKNSTTNKAKDLAKSFVADAVKATISNEGKRLNKKISRDGDLTATESVLADRDAKKKDIAAKKERISDLMDKLSSDDLTDKDKSIITDGITGIIVPPRDIDSLILAMEKCIARP